MTLLARANRTWLLIGASVLVVVLVIAGFFLVRWLTAPSSPGQVSFTAAGTTARTEASQFCDVAVTRCGADPSASAVLRVPRGTPLEVGVPGEVAAAPWQIVFAFRDATGATQQGRSPVFAPGSRSAFTLVLPGSPGRPGQLQSAEVQQYGTRLTDGPQGVQFTTRTTWVLSVDDR